MKASGSGPRTPSVTTAPLVHGGVLPPAGTLSFVNGIFFFFNIKLSDGLTLRVEIESHKNGEINIAKQMPTLFLVN